MLPQVLHITDTATTRLRLFTQHCSNLLSQSIASFTKCIKETVRLRKQLAIFSPFFLKVNYLKV